MPVGLHPGSTPATSLRSAAGRAPRRWWPASPRSWATRPGRALGRPATPSRGRRRPPGRPPGPARRRRRPSPRHGRPRPPHRRLEPQHPLGQRRHRGAPRTARRGRRCAVGANRWPPAWELRQTRSDPDPAASSVPPSAAQLGCRWPRPRRRSTRHGCRARTPAGRRCHRPGRLATGRTPPRHRLRGEQCRRESPRGGAVRRFRQLPLAAGERSGPSGARSNAINRTRPPGASPWLRHGRAVLAGSTPWGRQMRPSAPVMVAAAVSPATAPARWPPPAMRKVQQRDVAGPRQRHLHDNHRIPHGCGPCRIDPGSGARRHSAASRVAGLQRAPS